MRVNLEQGHILTPEEIAYILSTNESYEEALDRGEFITFQFHKIVKHDVFDRHCYEVVGWTGSEFSLGESRDIEGIQFIDYRDPMTGKTQHETGVRYRYRTDDLIVSGV